MKIGTLAIFLNTYQLTKDGCFHTLIHSTRCIPCVIETETVFSTPNSTPRWPKMFPVVHRFSSMASWSLGRQGGEFCKPGFPHWWWNMTTVNCWHSTIIETTGNCLEMFNPSNKRAWLAVKNCEGESSVFYSRKCSIAKKKP